MKDGPLSKLTITKDGQRATQYKKILDALPVFCVDKGYKFINYVIQTGIEQLQAAFMLPYPNTALWLNTYHVEFVTVDLVAIPDANIGLRTPITEVHERSHVFNPNL